NKFKPLFKGSGLNLFFYNDWFERIHEEFEVLSKGEILRWQRHIDGLSLTGFKNITGIDRGLCCKYEADC
ncbi:hypothetical protein V7111_24600, partial [Neobacillus niacini]|uniref:hypothetical protein n=1 Tax=Neobacillus niacini TaxID=86668 RepID=UPI0030038EE6